MTYAPITVTKLARGDEDWLFRHGGGSVMHGQVYFESAMIAEGTLF
jgi:hypothetical protein